MLSEVGGDAWFDVCALDDLEPGGALLRVTISGIRAVAFRSPDGAAGIVQEACAHRCASLVLGRNEDGGIRCIYHGWKFGPDGDLVEVPTEPDQTRVAALRDRVRIKAFPVKVMDGRLFTRLEIGS